MNRIKELRVNLGLTQKNIAEKLGCNQTAVGKYEREELEPNIEVLCKLAEMFNCSIDYLVCREDDFGFIQTAGEEYSSAEKRIISIYRGLSERDKRVIDAIFNSYITPATIKKEKI